MGCIGSEPRRDIVEKEFLPLIFGRGELVRVKEEREQILQHPIRRDRSRNHEHRIDGKQLPGR